MCDKAMELAKMVYTQKSLFNWRRVAKNEYQGVLDRYVGLVVLLRKVGQKIYFACGKDFDYPDMFECLDISKEVPLWEELDAKFVNHNFSEFKKLLTL